MAFTSIIACILALINIGSITAFNGVISVAIAGLFSSYILTSSLLLYRRCTGAILPAGQAFETSTPSITPDGMQRVYWGPWKIPGAFGIANNAFACVYLTFVFFFSFWPTASTVNAATMNYSILVTGVIALFSTVYYLVWAKHSYHGPVIETDSHEAHEEPIILSNKV